MITPHYTGRRVDGHARLFYVWAGGEKDITRELETVGITFITNVDWLCLNAQLVEAARTILWHETQSHTITLIWGHAFAWENMAFLQDGWTMTRDVVNSWLTARAMLIADATRNGKAGPLDDRR